MEEGTITVQLPILGLMKTGSGSSLLPQTPWRYCSFLALEDRPCSSFAVVCVLARSLSTEYFCVCLTIPVQGYVEIEWFLSLQLLLVLGSEDHYYWRRLQLCARDFLLVVGLPKHGSVSLL